MTGLTVRSHWLKCPCCGMHRMEPSVNTVNTPWSDTCGCSDHDYCMWHRVGDESLPVRPDDQALLLRAQARAERQLREYDELSKKFEYVEGLMLQARVNDGAQK